MRVSNVVVKLPERCRQVLIQCPVCTHPNWFRVESKGRVEGDEKVECHSCHATLIFHWESLEVNLVEEEEGEVENGTGESPGNS